MIRQAAAGSAAGTAAEVAGMAVLAAAVAALAAIAYRWLAADRIQEGLAVLVGLAAVAVTLNITASIGQFIGGGAGVFDLGTALVNTVTFVLAAGATLVGRRVGDRLAVEAAVVTGRRTVEADVGRLVSAVGRVVPVTVPDDLDDIDGYDPVSDETKAALAGRTLLIPRQRTVAELEARFRTRLAEDYDVGHVDVELAADGTVEYLALGERAAGLGPTLAPGTAAVAVRGDPAFAASAGDVVELRRPEASSEPVAVGELRATAGDVVTVALDEPEALALPPDARYRLVTRPATPRADREFASVLRVADETMAAVTVEPDGALVGTTPADADAAVVAVQPADGDLLAVPPRDRPFAAGDVVYAVGRPGALRRLEAGPEPEPSS